MPDNQIVNDEATIAVTVRCAGRATRDRLARSLLPVLPAIEQAIRPLVDADAAFISGIHIDLPDFQPSRYQPAPAIDWDALGRILAQGLQADLHDQKQHALEQVAERLGLDVGGGQQPGVAP
jgi:phage tail protein X